jgi:nanoRNase/pAp phosphatase (c-di-AMP/oligoRNAs hydrolase)
MVGCGPVGRILMEKMQFTVVLQEKGSAEKGAVHGDLKDRDFLVKAGAVNADVIVVVEDMVTPVIRELNPDAVIIAYGEETTCTADIVVSEDEPAAHEIVHQIHHYQRLKRKKDLETVLVSGRRMAVILHDNPDPDCISSAISLKVIAETHGVLTDLFYGGHIGYRENQALVELLEITLISCDTKPDFSPYDITAFVDHSPWDYTSIGREVNPDIVIDHHLPPNYRGKFVDVREDAGSTATILTEYLQLFNIDIDPKLATGLLYGLLVDTDSFRRGIHEQDIKALTVLRKKFDTELLFQIERARFSDRIVINHEHSDFLNVLGEAVKNVQFKDKVIFSFVGEVVYRDAVSHAADFLLKMEEGDLVLVYGTIKDVVYISVRSWDETLHIGMLLKEAFHDLGSAGGHPLSGGAAIPLKNLPKDVEKEIVNRFLRVLGYS